MHKDIANGPSVLSEEIKALLILLLLKGGTPSEEIETALRLAGSRPASSPEAPEHEAMCPLARAAVLAMAPPVAVAQPTVRQASLQPVASAKQVFRNDQLAPLHGYAA